MGARILLWQLVMLLLFVWTSPAAAQTYTVPTFSVPGGGHGTGGSYSLDGTIGVAAASGQLTGGPYTIVGGFWATAITAYKPFTDNVLAAGSSVICAVHVTELRSRIDALRVRFGLTAFGWTDNSLVAGMTMSAVHLTELRTALQQAYSAAGPLAPPLPSFTDPTIVPGSTSIRAVHVKELRDGVVLLEGF